MSVTKEVLVDFRSVLGMIAVQNNHKIQRPEPLQGHAIVISGSATMEFMRMRRKSSLEMANMVRISTKVVVHKKKATLMQARGCPCFTK